MKIDKNDISLLKILWEIKKSETLSTTDLAKKIFSDDIKNVYDLRKKDEFIRKRMKKWLKLGVLDYETIKNRHYFFLLKENIKFGEAKVKIKGQKSDIKLNFKDSVLLKHDGKWVLIEL